MKNTIITIKEILADVSGLSVSEIPDEGKLAELGIDSILNAEIVAKLKKKFGIQSISSVVLYEYPTAKELSQFIESQVTSDEDISCDCLSKNHVEDLNDGDIAIIGVKAILPCGEKLNDFMSLLQKGEDTVREIDNSRWNHDDYYPHRIKTKWWSNIDNIKGFDPLFFGLSPRQAAQMDPQERLFLETTWNALEDAGYSNTDELSGKVGVFVGVTNGMYSFQNHSSWENEKQSNVALSYWSMANRISYIFNFSGPSLSVDTACSSSLYALHLAIRSLRNHECDVAIVGGSNLIESPRQLAELCDLGMISSVNKTRAFGDNADGFVYGEAVCSIVIKRLSDSIRDNDNIYAVIKGSAIGGTGKTSGYTVPNPKAQRQVMEEAINDAKIPVENISYIEAHGTGTRLGDPIEVTAISNVFKHNVFIGSVKSNIGHTEATSGLVSLLKIILQLQYKTLFKSINADVLNGELDWEHLNVAVVNKECSWNPLNGTRCALVNSFGAGGSNVSVVVEEYVSESDSDMESSREWLFPLSAKSDTSLRRQCTMFLNFLKTHQCTLSDLSFTLCKKRKHFSHGIIFRGRDVRELIRCIEEHLNQGVLSGFDLDEIESMDFMGVKCKNVHGVSLYQFDNENYWEKYSSIADLTPNNALQIKENSAIVHSSAFFIKDHVLNGINILPGVAHLEILRRFVKANSPFEIKNYTWVSPIVFLPNQQSEHIDLCEENGIVSLKVDGTLASQGKISLIDHNPDEVTCSLADYIHKHSTYLSSQDVYTKFQSIGWLHGKTLQSVSFLMSGKDSSLAFVDFVDDASVKTFSSDADFSLNPCVMDGILQSVIGISSVDSTMPYLPFCIDRMRVYSPIPERFFVLAKVVDISPDIITYDIDVFSLSSVLILEIKRFRSKRAKLLGHRTADNSDEKSVIQAPEKVSFYVNSIDNEEFFQIPQSSSVILGVTDAAIKTEFQKHFRNCIFVDTIEELCTAQFSFSRIIDFRGIFQPFDLEADSLYEYHLAFFKGVQSILKKHIKYQKWTIFLKHTAEYEIVANMLVAFGKTLQKEYPGTAIEVILLDDVNDLLYVFSQSIKSNVQNLYSKKFFLNNKRLFSEGKIAIDDEARFVNQKPCKLEKKGTYIISGGTGGIGLILCQYLMQTYQANVVLLSRSQVDQLLQQRLYDWSTMYNASVTHVQADVSNMDDVIRGLLFAKSRYGKINGIFHAAAVLRDALIFSKDPNTIKPVFDSKIKGAINFLKAIEQHEFECDFISLFSSISSVIGGIAQSDYGAANGVLDRLSTYFNERYRLAGLGTIVQSVNWPYWHDGGMRIGIDLEKIMAKQLGILAISNEDGMHSMEYCLSQCETADQIVVSVEDGSDTFKKILIPNYDQKKVVVTEKINDISQNTSCDNKSILYELKRIVAKMQHIQVEKVESDRSLSEYGFDSISYTELSNILNLQFGLDVTPALFFEINNINDIANYITKEGGTNDQNSNKNEANNSSTSECDSEYYDTDYCDENDVAIIGVSCKLPGANDKDEFWDNLVHSRKVSRTIPEDRWDWRDYYGDPTEKNKTNIKYGAFINDYARFDNDFFKIPARYATYMDPQHRIFLEETWKCIEDAGYNADDLSGKKIAVFVGASTYDYAKVLGEQNNEIDSFTSSGNVHCMIANQISYFFNLQGESAAVDTACSSSLVALSKAVDAILLKNNEFAIVGGVNLLLHPSFYISFSRAGMLSPDGECKTFDRRANGYLRGEGCVVLLLKKARKAIADKDNIYGVIKNIGVNHNGKSNTITSPNTNAQVNLLKDTYNGINLSDIDFIETHGTGTPIGDVVECNALKQVFSGGSRMIGLGSVKTNIGHLEPASGLASVVKVLMSLRHGMYPANMNCEYINEDLRLEGSNLYLVNKNVEWNAKQNHIRMAGISSFGFGGVNAHAVIAECRIPCNPKDTLDEKILTLSGMNEESLEAQVNNAVKYFKSIEEDMSLDDVCYTYNTGRKRMPYRIAVIFRDKADLIQKLEAVKAREHINGVFMQNVQYKPNTNLERIAVDFVMNDNHSLIDFYKGKSYYKVSLPTYPFAGGRYTVIGSKSNVQDGSRMPLGSYTKIINEHILLGQKVVPGALWIDLISNSLGLDNYTIETFELLSICSLSDFKDISIERQNRDTRDEIVVSGSGKTYAKIILRKNIDKLYGDCDISEASRKHALRTITPEYLYDRLAQQGIEYGNRLKNLSIIHIIDEDHIIAELNAENISQMTQIIDAAFQSTAFFEQQRAHVPARIKNFLVSSKIIDTKYLYVKRCDQHFDICFLSSNWEMVGKCDRLITVPCRKKHDSDLEPSIPSSMKLCEDRNDELADRVFVPRLKYITLEKEEMLISGIVAVSEKNDAVLQSTEKVVQFDEVNERLLSGVDTLYVLDNKTYKSVNDANSIAVGFIKMLRTVFDITVLQHLKIVFVFQHNKYSAILEGIAKTFAEENTLATINIVVCDDSCALRAALQKIKVVKLPKLSFLIGNDFYIERLKEVDFKRSGGARFNNNDVFLIIGGAGGVGNVLARYLVDRFDAHVIIVGRRNLNDIDSEKLYRNIEYVRCDITDKGSLKQLLAEVMRKYKKLRGIFHSAMNLHDISIVKMTNGDFLKGASVKTNGTENLLELTAESPVGFIVLFSSIETFIPRAGQSNYISGCMFQDRVCGNENRIVKTINFGYWDRVGSVSNAEYKARFQDEGIYGLTEQYVCDFIVTFAQNRSIPHCAIIKANKEYFGRHNDVFDM